LSTAEGGLTLALPAGQKRIPLEDLVNIATAARAAPHAAHGQQIGLANGDVLYGPIAGAQAEAVLIDAVDVGTIAVSLDAIRRIDTEQASQPAFQEAVQWFDRSNQNDEDRILLTNGDIVRGFIFAIDKEGLSIDSSLGEMTIPHRLAVAVRLASSKTPPPPPEALRLILSFRSSGRLTMTDLTWTGNVIEARLLEGQTVRLEAERVTRVDVAGGRWVWLSRFRPISYQHTPMLSLGWDYRNDRNVVGGPLRVAGNAFDHGVGVHSRSILTYDLKGTYEEFVTSFGMDDESGPYADVSVEILVDGKRRFERSKIRRGTLYGPIRLDVTRANRIELITDFGENGDVQDRFDWVESALIR
jgi:hypothetical protein